MILSIKDPFTFEFLGLDAREAVSESDLEQALMDHLQEFMLELGEGFYIVMLSLNLRMMNSDTRI